MKKGKIRISSILFVAAFVILFFASTKTNGADWKFYARTAKKDIKYFYDVDSISHHSKNIVQVWTKIIPLSKERKDRLIQKRKRLKLTIEGYENYNYSLRLWEINCEDKTHSLLSYVDYNKKLSVLDSFTFNSSLWSPVIPESSIEHLYIILCPKKMSDD